MLLERGKFQSSNMKKQQLTTNTTTRTNDQQIFATQKSAVNSQRSIVKYCHASHGFTLVEMTVSLGLFTIIMFAATSSFLSIVNMDRKSRAVRIAADNLNVALEDISRRIKTGSSYYCATGGAGGEALNSVNDCPAGGDTLFFDDQNGERVKYVLTSNAIWRSVGTEPAIRATSPEISITTLKFVVFGSPTCGGTTPCTSNPPTSDAVQPIVTIVIDGSLGANGVTSPFKIQTTAAQRSYDN